MLASLAPASLQRPGVALGVASELHQVAVGADAAIELDGKGVVPFTTGDAVGPSSDEELVPALVIPVSKRSAEPPARLGFHGDRQRLRKEVKGEPGLEVAPPNYGTSPHDGGRLFPPDGPATEQGVATVFGSQQARFFIDHASERGFGHTRGGESAVEQITLDAGGGKHRIHPERDT